MLDVISVGDCAEDVFLELEEAKVHCDKGPGTCMICFHYADKVPVKSITQMVGGNAANNAVGLSRLGIKTALYSELGDDVAGKNIYAELKKQGVVSKYIFLRKKAKTNKSVILNFMVERTIFTYHEKRAYVLPRLEKSKYLYYTSMGEGFEKIIPAIERHVKENRVQMVFNPGTIHMKSSSSLIKKILSFSSILILNKEEAQFILGKDADVLELLTGLHSMGIKVVVITDGANGSYATDGKQTYYQKIFKTKLVDRTGCGDAFASAFLAALCYKKSIREALSWGAINSAHVLARIGPQDGLMTIKEMKAFNANAAKLRVKVKS